MPRSTLACAVLAAAMLTSSSVRAQQAGIVRVTIQTELGNIELAVDSAHAPRTAANFLRYIDAGRYEGGRFHRTVTMANQPTNNVKIEVIQWSAAPRGDREAFPAIELERTSVTGLKHVDGTISMARGGPNSATSDVFICIGDQPSLDFGGARNADGQGFAAFGQVISGMDIVRRIQASTANGQTLTPPIRILNIVRHRDPVVPTSLLGDWDDDYDGRHTVSATEWLQGRTTRYRIVQWDTARHFLVAQNDSANRSDGGKWTRIDWVVLPGMAPWEWTFCFSAYNAATRSVAETTSVARPSTPRTGCNGFPYSRLKRVSR